jgi:AGZA family xanthine/uracil permease-like MFS transporter
MDKGAVFVATCIAAAASTLVMAFYANYPIALAPGMGLNAFFAFTVVLMMKFTWQQALAAVFCSGVIFLFISIFRIREYIINAIPRNLKLAISAGVGLFLGIIALEESKIVVASPATLVTLGDLRDPVAILCLLGLILITALNYRKIIGGTLIGILAVTLIGIPFGLATYSGIAAMPPSLKPTLLQLDFSRVTDLSFLVVVLSFLFVDVFDNAGTLIGVTHRAGLEDADGNLPRMRQALIADSFAAMFGALIGTSTTTSYIESAAGVAAGGRTGLTAFFVAMLFLAALFFAPLAGMVPAYASSAALLYVACVMARGLAEIEWDDITEIRARGRCRHQHAADLFDRDRDRTRLHHLCACQAHCREIRRCQARGAGARCDLCGQICGGLTAEASAASAFFSARKSRQAKRFCSGLRNRKAGWKVASALISRVPVS